MTFQKVNQGYDPAQVDEYVAALRDGYVNMEREYKTLEAEKARLEEALKKRPNAEAVGQVLLDAREVARRVEEKAKAQAEGIVSQAKNEAARVLWDAKKELDGFIAARSAIERQVRELASVLDKAGGNGEVRAYEITGTA
jgi:cell division septum initiation protein DivIVA